LRIRWQRLENHLTVTTPYAAAQAAERADLRAPPSIARLSALRRNTVRDLWLALLAQVALALAVGALAGFGGWYAAKASALMAVAACLIAATVASHAPHMRFGPANRVTLLRLALVLLLAAAIGEPLGERRLLTWGAVGIAALAALLDAVAGPLARARGLASTFGASFDMETDALLMLVLCVLVVQLGKAGPWVLAAGLMRYAFVAAARLWPWMARALRASRRRQTVCVAQIVGLIVCLGPVVSRPVSNVIAAAGLALLTASFAADTMWLARKRHQP